jgi:hypothetical protein
MRDLELDFPLSLYGHGGGFYPVASEGSTSFFWREIGNDFFKARVFWSRHRPTERPIHL